MLDTNLNQKGFAPSIVLVEVLILAIGLVGFAKVNNIHPPQPSPKPTPLVIPLPAATLNPSPTASASSSSAINSIMVTDKEASTLDNLPQLYPSVSWVEQDNLFLGDDQQLEYGDFKTLPVKGKWWVSVQPDLDQAGKLINYYSSEMSKIGWVTQLVIKGVPVYAFSAMGPSGGTQGYRLQR